MRTIRHTERDTNGTAQFRWRIRRGIGFRESRYPRSPSRCDDGSRHSQDRSFSKGCNQSNRSNLLRQGFSESRPLLQCRSEGKCLTGILWFNKFVEITAVPDGLCRDRTIEDVLPAASRHNQACLLQMVRDTPRRPHPRAGRPTSSRTSVGWAGSALTPVYPPATVASCLHPQIIPFR
jgi:hypothetical protein